MGVGKTSTVPWRIWKTYLHLLLCQQWQQNKSLLCAGSMREAYLTEGKLKTTIAQITSEQGISRGHSVLFCFVFSVWKKRRGALFQMSLKLCVLHTSIFKYILRSENKNVIFHSSKHFLIQWNMYRWSGCFLIIKFLMIKKFIIWWI